MHTGNWKCSGCGGTITELPFVPRSESGLTCRTCYAKQKGGSTRGASSGQAAPDFAVADDAPDIPDFTEVAGEPAPDDGFGPAVTTSSEKPKFSGDWSCASCGGAITSLPFSPRNTSNLKCLDCFKQSKG